MKLTLIAALAVFGVMYLDQQANTRLDIERQAFYDAGAR